MSDFSLMEDVWNEICGYLETGDLNSISLTSRTLNRVATRYLYRKIQWDWNGNMSRYRIMSLWTTLVRNKDTRSRLCGLIREVHLLGRSPPQKTQLIGSPGIQGCSPDLTYITKTDKMPFYQEIDYLQYIVGCIIESPKDRADWRRSIAARNVYAMVALLLPFLYNLRSLKLDYTFLVNGGLPGVIIERLTSGANICSAELRNNFDHLEEIDYGTNALQNNLPRLRDNTRVPFGFSSQVIPIFRLQKIKHLKVWLHSHHGLRLWRVPGIQTDYTALKTLILDQVSIMDCALFKILQRMKNLRTLHLGMDNEESSSLYHVVPSYDDGECILNGLEALYECLEHLSISFSSTPTDLETASDTHIWGPLFRSMMPEFFQGFTRLKTLELPVELLNGFEDIKVPCINRGLPVTLERLGLRWDFQYVGRAEGLTSYTVRVLRDVLADFLRLSDRHRRVPLLQEVIIRLFISDDELDITVKECDDLIEEFNMEHPGPDIQEEQGGEADDTMEEAMFLAQLVAEGEVGQAVVVVEEAAEGEAAEEVEGEAEDVSG
ncbi:hypothetical protein BO83DRAFT_328768 [Aspergillus eucalypticola CBS 122712]|uniref:F-box domain-containing protein n=1 Tax=Aspergillus eucalypticola (strain CBS 122712 / IBT 29274) TaxID=1448314 RepID=A0A317WG79_ASPEC|nr:uncharacterized protein BO83DRAFT_328768 [Aspergillus eucalypticola CBS 122712]PWY85474.1 hypothetical protein BO83DRAFT_328768 [Aspergillus eucalypticola CBS 122712]